MGLSGVNNCHWFICCLAVTNYFFSRKTTIAFQPYLWLCCCIHYILSFNHKYRNDHRACSCNRNTSAFFQLWWFFALGVYNAFVYFYSLGCKQAGVIGLKFSFFF